MDFLRNLNSVDGGLELVDLFLQRFFNFSDVINVFQGCQLFLKIGIVDDDARLLLVDDVAGLTVGNLCNQTITS